MMQLSSDKGLLSELWCLSGVLKIAGRENELK